MSNPAIICDSGTGYLKIGRSDENFPSFTFPALVGRPLMRYEEKINDIEIKVFSNFYFFYIFGLVHK